MSNASPENPNVRVLRLESNGDAHIHTIGSPEDDKPNKTMLVLGATGSGKTTLINNFVNYIFGVQWRDDWRLKLIDDGERLQTAEVTAYQLYHNEDFQVPFSLTIIDTPGFGRADDPVKDQEITDKIKQFFLRPNGILTVDAVCFVMQSSIARLTKTQKYPFDSILSIFGNDIISNIIALITFADVQSPPVIQAIKAANIPCGYSAGDKSPAHFKFNNSALYTFKIAGDEEESAFEHMWKMTKTSNRMFFEHLDRLEPKSLPLSKVPFEELQRLRTTVAELVIEVQMHITTLDKINQTIVEINKFPGNFVDKGKLRPVVILLTKAERVQSRHSARFCLKCIVTCQIESSLEHEKKHCCDRCPKKCHWSVHTNTRHKLKWKTGEQKQTVEELKKKYQKHEGEKMNKDKLISRLQLEHDQVRSVALEMTQEIAENLSRIAKLLCRPDTVSTSEYIDLLIQAEKREERSGYQRKILNLQKMREQVQVVGKKLKEKDSTQPKKEKRKGTWL